MKHLAPQDSQHALEAQLLSNNAPWHLAQGYAVTLRPRVAGVLRVMRGPAWMCRATARWQIRVTIL